MKDKKTKSPKQIEIECILIADYLEKLSQMTPEEYDKEIRILANEY